MSRSSVLVGLLSIAIGTVLGFIWVDRLTGQYWYYDPKYVVTLLVLALYAAYLQLSRTTSWRGARASRLCIFNFVIVIFRFTTVKLKITITKLRRPSLPALHLQFRNRNLEFHGGEPVPLALPPLFLKLWSCHRGALRRVPAFVVASL